MKKKDDTVVAVAQIGCNGVAHEHAKAHLYTGNTRLVAVCDIDGNKAKQFASQYEIADWCINAGELFERDDIDMIDIVTPDDTHAVLAVAAANAGKNILIEKPLATSLEQVQDITDAVKANNVKAMCAQSLRWLPKVRKFVETVNSGVVGKPVYVRLWGGCPPFWSPKNWPKTASGGKAEYLLIHNGMHWMDLLTWMLDDYPDSVYTIGHPGQDGVPLWEYFVVNMTFSKGAIALAEDNRIVQPGGYPMPGMGIYVVGTKGSLALEATKDFGVSLYNKDGISFPGSHVYISPPENNFAGEIRHMADCILCDNTPQVSLEHSKRVLNAILHAVESFKTGKRLEVNYG